MDIANNVKKRVRTKKTLQYDRDSPPLKEGKNKTRLSRTLFKRQVKTVKVSTIQKKTSRNVKAGKLSVLSLINKKRRKVSDDESSEPTKPAFYRTRNATTIAYLDSLQVVRRTLAPKKLIKPLSRKKNAREGSSEEFPAISPKLEVIPSTRVLSNGLWFEVGDIISVFGDEQAKGRIYYAQIRAFLKDQFCEQYVAIRWYLPASTKPRPDLPFSFSPFDFNNYLEGPEHDEPLSMNNVHFVAHAPTAAPITYKPGHVPQQIDNPYSRLYRDREGLKILDVPTPTATSAISNSKFFFF